jgi:transcription elongation factor GreA
LQNAVVVTLITNTKGELRMAVKQMSREGFKKLEQELEVLVTVKRKEIAEKLKVARSYGDLSENAEYDEAKNEQAILEAQISELQNTISNAVIVDDENISVDEIGMGSIIKIKKVGSDKVETLQIVGTNESNFKEHKISDESPIGKAALKKKVGDIFLVEAPAGEMEYEVVEISK